MNSMIRNLRRPHPFAFLAACLAVLMLAGRLSGAEEDQDKVLARERWRESAFGVSLRPPLDTRIHQFNTDDAQVRITKDDVYAISVYIKKTQQDYTIDQVVRAAIEQFGFIQPTAKILDQAVIKPAKRPGWLLYFGVNLPIKDLPDARGDLEESLKKVAREQLRKADGLRTEKRDYDAFRMYLHIASNSPDRAVAAKAGEWVKAYKSDVAFMNGFLRDEARRTKFNPRAADNKPWVMAQAFMQLSPRIFVMVQLDVDFAHFTETRTVFEAMLDSIDVQNPQELNELRKKLLERGDAIAKGLSHRKLVGAMMPEKEYPIVDNNGNAAGTAPLRLQYMRILDQGSDIGWMKTVHRQRRDQIVTIEKQTVTDARGRTKEVPVAKVQEIGVNGIAVDVYARVHLPDKLMKPDGKELIVPRIVDTHSQTFQGEKGDYESWSVRTTIRTWEFPKAEQSNLQGAPIIRGGQQDGKAQLVSTTWLETGVRNLDQITIIREGPTGIERFIWQKPPIAYVSQVELYLMGPLLPREGDGEYGFYAYSPNTGSVSFRKIRVVPSGDGSYRVMSQMTPDSPELRSEYDRDGNLVGRELGEGRELVPTTREELAKLYKLKLPDETVEQPKPKDFKPLPPSDRLPR